MKSRDLFELAVRIIGAYTLFQGVSYLVEAALFYTQYITNPDITFRYYLIYGWINIFISFLLIRAPWILTNFAYPLEDKANEELEDPSDAEDS